MKKWNAAEISVLDINMTESGWFDGHHETLLFENDSKKKKKHQPVTPYNPPVIVDPVTPTEPEIPATDPIELDS